MNKYGQPGENSTTEQIDYLQENFKCCGSFNYTSWADTPYGKSFKTPHVPTSCCRNKTGCFEGDLEQMKENVTTYIYDHGCVGQVDNFLKKNLYYLGAGAIAFLVLLLLGMIGSCVVLWQRKEASYFNLGA